MAIQNDNTIVTKGDLKELYTEKIAPYLGGGISYYHTDRTGEELRKGCYVMSGTIPSSTSQNFSVTLTAKEDSSSDFLLSNNRITVPEGMTIFISANVDLSPGTASTADTSFNIYDYKNSKTLGYLLGTHFAGGYSWGGSTTLIYTAPTGGAEVGIRCTYCVGQRVISSGSSNFTVTEIGRIVDPVKYVSNNSDLQETPVGNIISYMGNSVPKHYLACDGATYNIGSYPELEEFIIDEFGSINYFGGDGTTTWAVPDLRGEFLRGTGTNSHTNQGNGANVGIHQDGTEHWNFRVEDNGNNIYSSWASDEFVHNKDTEYGGNGSIRQAGRGSTLGIADKLYYTSRPTNTSVNYCIKYESTYHAFFSNTMYKVNIPFSTVASTISVYATFDPTNIIGDTSLVDTTNNQFIAPMDGWYSVSFNSSQGSSYKVPAIYLERYEGNTKIEEIAMVNGFNTGETYYSGTISTDVYMKKNQTIRYRVHNTGALSGEASFCLLTSNYNPTILSADKVYSENEQMIGYWKDSKPLYQKTLVYTNTLLGNDLPTDLDKTTINIIDYDFVHYANSTPTGDVVNKGGCHPNGYNTWGSWLYFVKSSDSNYWKVASRVGSSLGVSNCNFTITVRYTKTTDEAASFQIENSLLLNRPDLWEVGREYSFGGNLYGKRYTGTLSGATGHTIKPIDASFTSSYRLISCGGGAHLGNNTNQQLAVPYNDNDYFLQIQKSINAGGLIIYYQGNSTWTYDIWVTYKK